MQLSKHLTLLISVLLFSGCTNNSKKRGNVTAASINKVWVFAGLMPASAVWVGGNMLDLTRPDTLLFAYKKAKVPATKYAYKTSKDTLYITQQPAYKILSVTSDTLKLEPIFRSAGAKKKAQVVLIYVLK